MEEILPYRRLSLTKKKKKKRQGRVKIIKDLQNY